MKRYITAFSLLFIVTVTGLYAQDQDSLNLFAPRKYDAPLDKLSAGVGVGYEYGGVGANAIFYPIKNLGFFGGGGWYYVDPGYNFGVKLRLFTGAPSVTIIPYAEFMYGTNTYVYYKNGGSYSQFHINKTFSNFTFGGGVDIRPGNSKLGFLSLALYVPLRSPDVKNFKNNYVGQINSSLTANKLYWLNASIGYKFILWKNNKAAMWTSKPSDQNY
ncbi:MAG TPA: hypothetical protein VMT76_18690 [Puia sp.]|nr:hypothetical protein [Puia sp.]